ncbi:MAG: hypothetical protein KFB95_05935 [Simkaniaceae bacterium]|nr:MAG: hypothetical protein KFB95_05935 [Simkaniaceae bacterium]
MDTCVPYSGALVLYPVNTSHVDTSKELTRFASTSFFHNLNLLRRDYSHKGLTLSHPLKKIDNALRTFLTNIEDLRASTPCIVGRFYCNKLQKILSTINNVTAAGALEAYQDAKEQGITALVPLYGIDKTCQDLDAETEDTHVSIETWLDSFQTEGEENENFDQYCLRKLASRIDVYTTLLIELDCHPEDLKNITESNGPALQDLNRVDEAARGLLCHRFAFEVSIWKPSHSFAKFALELAQKGPQILFGNFPPSCYKEAPKEKLRLRGRAVLGWAKGSEEIKRPFSSSVVVVGCEKRAAQELVYYITPIDNYSNLYLSSYRKIRETAIYIFKEVYAVHLL